MSDLLKDLFGDIFGLDKASENLAEGIKGGITELSRSIFKSLNYWASIIEDFHTGTPEQRAKARIVVTKIFGPIEPDELSIQWELRLRLGGFDSRTRPLRVAVMLDTGSTIGTLEEHIKNASRSDVNFVPVIGNHPPAPTDENAFNLDLAALKERVTNAADGAAGRILHPATWKDWFKTLSRSQQRRHPSTGMDEVARENVKEVVAYRRALLRGALAELVMAAVDQKVKLHADKAEMTFPWSMQPFITLLIPKSDLEAHPDLQVSMIIHKPGDPSKRLVQYHDEFEFPMKLLRTREIQSKHDLGTLNCVATLVNMSSAT